MKKNQFLKRSKNIQQNVASYFAVFEPAEEGSYNVSFPDFPGCVTFGKNFEEAKEKAKEVLGLWIEELVAENATIPLHPARPIIDQVNIALPV